MLLKVQYFTEGFLISRCDNLTFHQPFLKSRRWRGLFREPLRFDAWMKPPFSRGITLEWQTLLWTAAVWTGELTWRTPAAAVGCMETRSGPHCCSLRQRPLWSRSCCRCFPLRRGWVQNWLKWIKGDILSSLPWIWVIALFSARLWWMWWHLICLSFLHWTCFIKSCTNV